MPILRAPYDPASGPLINGLVSYPRQLISPRKTPAVADVVFLVDTGATKTHIYMDVVNQVGLPMHGQRSVWSMSGPATVDLHIADLQVAGIASYLSVEVCALSSRAPNAKYTAILGRDILDTGALELDGPGRTLTLILP